MATLFTIFNPGTKSFDSLDLAELELVLRDRPDGEWLRLGVYDAPEFPHVPSYDFCVEGNLDLTVGVWDEIYTVHGPTEWLLVTRSDDRIRMKEEASGNPVARCDNCHGLIRAIHTECPSCTWQQWASSGSLIQPIRAVVATTAVCPEVPCGHCEYCSYGQI